MGMIKDGAKIFWVVEELHVDSSEVCNPLGPSQKKIPTVYWVLVNVPPGLCSMLTAIYLAILCKPADAERVFYNVALSVL